MAFTNGSILIVDDSALTRREIGNTLRAGGFGNLHEADCAETVLEMVKKSSFDLFLLDILMPGMDGMQLCKELKSMPKFADTPVLFVTGTSDMESNWKSFEIGAVDYIAKPFHPYELLARVKTHLDLRQKTAAVEKYAHEMEILAAERAQQLIHSDRLSTLGVLAAEIIHEIRNPIGSIAANAQFIEKVTPDIANAIEYAWEHGMEKTTRLEIALEGLLDSVKGIRADMARAQEITENIRTFSRKGSVQLEEADIEEVINQAVAITHNRLKSECKLKVNSTGNLPRIMVSRNQLIQVFANLILNSSDAIKEKDSPEININLYQDKRFVICEVEDNGYGMDDETRRKIFNPFFTTKNEQDGTGLGLSISRQIIEKMHGTIEVASTLGKGTTFTIKLSKNIIPDEI